MKNVLNITKKGILMVSMFATMLSFADEKSLFIIENNDERTSLSVNAKQGDQLTIKDTNGVILYKEIIKETGLYSKGFDLTELPNGTYIFELDKDVEIQTIPFTVISHTVAFKKEKEAIIFKPVTRVKGNLVYISRLSLNKAPMDISIFYTDREYNHSEPELIYSETVKNTENMSRIYKLTGKKSSDYKIVFKTEDRVFTTQID